MNVFNEEGLSLDQCMSAKEIVLSGICINSPSFDDMCTQNSFISGTMTIEMCVKICSTYGFKYAGIK